MSRRDIIEAARSLGIRSDFHQNGRRFPKHLSTLRVELLERCYGKNLGAITGKAYQIDEQVLRGVDCALGKLGYYLMVSQAAIRDARNGLIEWKRLTELKRRRPKDEARMLDSVVAFLAKAREAQEQHEASVCGKVKQQEAERK